MQSLPEIADYQVIRELGRGGMSRVYLAIQEALQREVAVKIMSRNLDDLEKLERRFLNEARTLARLSHRNIVTVIDIRKTEAATFMSMEYLPGGTLGARAARGLSVSEAVSVIAQIASALQFAHDHGVIHRDMKPDNILFRANGTPVLTDFGIAKEQNANKTSMTQAGMFVGTPSYMSPEQIQGAAVDGRSDQYSLGVVLYEILRGKKPFVADSPTAVLLMHLQEIAEPLPEDLADFQPIIDRMLAKKPEDRFPSCAEFAKELRRTVTKSETLWALVQSEPDVSVSEQLRSLGFSGTHTMPGRVVTDRGTVIMPPRSITDSGPTHVGKPPKDAGGRDETVVGGAVKPATKQFPSVGDLVSPQQIGALLARDPLQAQDVSLAAAHLRRHLEKGAGTALKLQLLQRLIQLAEYAENEEQLAEARHVLDCASGVLGHIVDFGDVVTAIKFREEAFAADFERTLAADQHLADAQNAIRARVLLPPDEGNALDHLRLALAANPDLAQAQNLLKRLPTAILAVIDALMQREELDSAAGLAERATKAFPEHDELAERSDTLALEIKIESGRKAQAQRLRDAIEEFQTDPMGQVAAAVSTLLELGEVARKEPEAVQLADAIGDWCGEIATLDDPRALESALAVLRPVRSELAGIGVAAKAAAIDAKLTVLQHAEESDRKEAQLLDAIDRAMKDASTLLAVDANGFVSAVRAAVTQGLADAVGPLLLAAFPEMERLTAEAVRSGQHGAKEVDDWLTQLGDIAPVRPMLPRLRNVVVAARAERDLVARGTVIRNAFSSAIAAEPKQQRVLKELGELLAKRPDHPVVVAALDATHAAMLSAAGSCDTDLRRSELGELDAWYTAALSPLADRGQRKLAEFREVLEAADARRRAKAGEQQLLAALDAFERDPTRDGLAELSRLFAAQTGMPESVLPRLAGLRAKLDEQLARSISDSRWSDVDPWLLAAGALLPADAGDAWRAKRDEAVAADAARQLRREEALLAFKAKLDRPDIQPTDLARVFIELRRLAPDSNEVPVDACAGLLHAAYLAAIATADESGLAVIEAVVAPWSRLALAGVSAGDLLAGIEARRSALAEGPDVALRHQATVLLSQLEAVELDLREAENLVGVARSLVASHTVADVIHFKDAIRAALSKHAEQALQRNALREAVDWLGFMGPEFESPEISRRLAELRKRLQKQELAEKKALPRTQEIPAVKDAAKTARQLDDVDVTPPGLEPTAARASAKDVAAAFTPPPTIELPAVPAASSKPQEVAASVGSDATRDARTLQPPSPDKKPAPTVELPAAPKSTGPAPEQSGSGKAKETVQVALAAEPAVRESKRNAGKRATTPAAKPAEPVASETEALDEEWARIAAEHESQRKKPPSRKLPMTIAVGLVLAIAGGGYWWLTRDRAANAVDVAALAAAGARGELQALLASDSVDRVVAGLAAFKAQPEAVRTTPELVALRKQVEEHLLTQLQKLAQTHPTTITPIIPKLAGVVERDARLDAIIDASIRAAASDRAGPMRDLRTQITSKRWFEPLGQSAWNVVREAPAAEKDALLEMFVAALEAELQTLVVSDAEYAKRVVAEVRKNAELARRLSTALDAADKHLAASDEMSAIARDFAALRGGPNPLQALLTRGQALVARAEGVRFKSDLEVLLIPRLRQEVDRLLQAKSPQTAAALVATAKSMFGRVAEVTALETLIAGASTPEPAAIIENGVLIVDASPWANVVSIKDPTGQDIALPADRSTPLRIEVPVGRYVVAMGHPASRAPTTVTVDVGKDRVAQAYSRFEVVNVDRILE